MSTSDKFSPVTEPVEESYAGLAQSHAGSPAETLSELDRLAPRGGSKFVEMGLAVATWISSVFLLAIMSVVFVVPYALPRVGTNQEALKQFLLTDRTAIFLQILSAIPAHLLTLCVVWAVVTRLGKRPFWQTLGWSWGGGFGFWSSAALAIALLAMGWALTATFNGGETELDKIISSSNAARYTTAFLATFTAPLVEEMVYRGVLYSALQRIVGTASAVFGVLLLFTLVHVPQYWPNLSVIAVIGLLSIALTIVRAYTDRLLPCFVMHLVFNGVSSIIIIIEPYLLRLVNDHGQQKAEGALFMLRAALKACVI